MNKKIKNLKTECQLWNSDEWEKYLSSIETPLREEYLQDPLDVEHISNEDHNENLIKSISDGGQ